MLKYSINKQTNKKQTKPKKLKLGWGHTPDTMLFVFITGNIHQNSFHEPFVQSDMKQHVM